MISIRQLLRMFMPRATVFFAGGCMVMIVLAASRLVGRHVGSSLYTWTATFTVVLAGVAVGNYLGGRIADRYHLRRALSVLFGLSSAACVAILIANNVAGEWLGLWRLSWPVHVFVHALLVFPLTSCLLGAVIPIASKMAMERGLPAGTRDGTTGPSPDAAASGSVAIHEVGRTVGGIYASSAAGGFSAILLGGFVLIPTTGSATILWLTAAAMLMVAVVYWISCWALYLWAMVFAALAAMGMAPADWAQGAGTTARLRERPDPNVIYDDQTAYGRVAVRRTAARPDRRELLEGTLQRSETAMDDATRLECFYSKVCAGLAQAWIAGGGKPSTMVIGAGGYVFPRYLKALRPDSLVEVVEPDPGVTSAAIAAFGLDRNSTIETVRTDARDYVNRVLRQQHGGGSAKRYDLICEGAIRDYAVPFPLVTKEFNDSVARLLADDGVYAIDLIDAYESSRLLGAVVCTLEQTFPNVYVVAGRGGLPPLRSRFVVLAARRRLDVQAILHKFDEHLEFQVMNPSQMEHLRNAGGGVILTDDYAPVENLVAPVVRCSAGTILAQKHLDRARALQDDGRDDLRHAWELPHGGSPDPSSAMRSRGLALCDRSVEQYRRAIELDPSLSIEAYNEIGAMRIEQEKPAEAAQAFRNAIEYHQATGSKDPAIAGVYRNLGMLLRRMGKTAEANAQFAEAAEWFRIDVEENPRSVVGWEQLGGVLAMREDMKGASDAFEKAMALEPGNLAHYEKLARTLERQKRYGEAIEVVRRQMKLLEDHHDRKAATQARQHLELLEYERAKQPR